MMATIHIVRRIFGPTGMAHGLGAAYRQESDGRTWIARQEKLERDRQRQVNPFHFSQDLADCTSMPAEVLHDWLLDHDYPPYHLHGGLGWEDWWQVYHSRLTDAQYDGLWCVLDRVSFFDLVELPCKPSDTTAHRIYLRVASDNPNLPVEATATPRVGWIQVALI